MPKVTHFEIPSDKPLDAMNFYRTVFGWEFNQFGQEEYWMSSTGNPSERGIDGAVMKKRHPEQPVVNSILVDSVDQFCEKIVAAGGQIVVPKMPIGEIGFLSYFKDLDGNIFGIAEFSVMPESPG